MADVNLTVSADLAKLRAQLEQIGPITKDQAASMVKELERAYVRAETAAKKTADVTKKAMAQTSQSMKAAESAAKDLETQAGKLGSSAGKLTGVLDLLAPGLGTAAQGVADVSDTLEVFGSSLGFTTAATGSLIGVLGAVTAAYAVYNTSVENAAALEEIRAQSIDRVTAALRKQTDADIELRVVTGDVTETEGERLRIEEERQRQIQDLEAATIAKVRSNKEEIRTNEAIAGSLGFVSFGLLESAQAMGLLGKSTTQLTRENAELEKAYKEGAAAISAASLREDELVVTRDEVKRSTDEQKNAEERRLRSTRAASDADKAAAEALRQRSAAYAESLALMEEESRAQEQARGITESLTASTQARTRAALEGSAAVTAAMEHELARTLERYQEGTRAAGANSAAQLELTSAYEAEVASIEQEAATKRKKLADDERKQREEDDAAALEIQRAAIMEGVGLISESLSASADNQAAVLEQLTSKLESNSENMTESDKKALKERIAAQREAAMLTFGLNKAAQLATATVNTATAVTAALASAPPPANLIAAGVAGAAGGAQIAAIAAQQPAFHSGGMVPDEVQARLVTGEAVLSRVGRNVIGDEQIRAANAGMAPPVKVVAINQYRHEVFRPFIRDHLRLGGDLSTAIRGTRTVGQREAL